MKVSFYSLGAADAIRDLLIRDGWQAVMSQCNQIEATHPEVADERSVRGRLNNLGLLITGAARIEWERISHAGVR